MSSIHHHIHPLEGNQDQVPHLIPFFPVYDQPPFTYPSFSLHSPQPNVYHQKHEDDESSHSGGTNDPLLFVVSLPTKQHGGGDHDNDDDKDTSSHQHHKHDAQKNKSSVKWMSSKMRFMRKMMNSVDSEIPRKAPRRSTTQSPPLDQQPQPQGIVRVCSDCNTTKTPLWRSGPQGPKSLCNACGIRQRKARKAKAAAAASATVDEVDPSPKIPKEEVPEIGSRPTIMPFKKRCKFASASNTDVNRFEELEVRFGQNSHVHKVFPQDEKEAAILLMALSCGLVCR